MADTLHARAEAMALRLETTRWPVGHAGTGIKINREPDGLAVSAAEMIRDLAACCATPQWRCFHCNEVFTDRRTAEDHFGLDMLEKPACVAILTEGEKAIVEDRRMWRERYFEEETAHEKTAAELSALRWDAYRIRTKYGSRSSDSLWLAFEHVEGRMLAAEAALNAAPRWLASWLRRRAERIWKRRHG